MEGFMHWYNLHRRTIWIVIGVAILIFVMINVINSSLKQKEQPKNETVTNTTKMNTVSIKSDTSPITGEQITSDQKKTITIIDNFATYCNNGDIDAAYDLLSSDCKEQMYPTKDDFKTVYYNPVFGGSQREITVENWVGNIYKVRFAENALATGNFDESNITQDYITIVNENGQTKLNIKCPNDEVQFIEVRIGSLIICYSHCLSQKSPNGLRIKFYAASGNDASHGEYGTMKNEYVPILHNAGHPYVKLISATIVDRF